MWKDSPGHEHFGCATSQRGSQMEVPAHDATVETELETKGLQYICF